MRIDDRFATRPAGETAAQMLYRVSQFGVEEQITFIAILVGVADGWLDAPTCFEAAKRIGEELAKRDLFRPIKGSAA